MGKAGIILIGGGGHCKSCIDAIEQENKFTIAGIIDVPEKFGQNILGYPIIGCDDDLEDLSKKHDNFIITLGQIKTPNIRISLFKKIRELGGKFPTIISPRSYISRHSNIGEGTIILHNATVNASSSIGENCIINTGVIIEHDSTIEDNCHISTRVTLNGNCTVKNGTFIGSGSTINQGISIAEHCIIGSGSLVLKSISIKNLNSYETPSKTIN